MTVRLNLSAVRRTRWHEYAIRFSFGGAITLVAGMVAAKYGPGIGGIFLAFPAILPASATLLEKHASKNKEGQSREARGRMAVALDASGAALGGLGLLAFALLVWFLSARFPLWDVLMVSSMAWFAVSSVS